MFRSASKNTVRKPAPDGIATYAADPERSARVAGIATRLANLRRVPNAEKKLAIVLSSYPTKHSRVGDAVGLGTAGLRGRASPQ